MTSSANPAVGFAITRFLENYMSEYHAQIFFEFLISFTLWNIFNIIVMGAERKTLVSRP